MATASLPVLDQRMIDRRQLIVLAVGDPTMQRARDGL
jgi:hypothetical protein